MFQYTTETIINSNKGKLASGKRFEYLNVNGVKRILIDGVAAFDPECITKVYRTEYRQAKSEEATFTVPLVNSGDVLRVAISIREEGTVRASIQDAYLRHRKPFYYEIISSGVAATDAAAIVALIKKDMSVRDEKFFKADITSGATIKLTAMDCHIRFIVDKFNVATVPSARSSALTGAQLLGFEDYTDLSVALTISKAGDCGAGTVEHLVKDLRIPTGASINPFAADHGGKPVPGGEYVQFLVEYVTDRHHVSGTVVGSVGEKSLTSHVFFVNQAVAGASSGTLADDFEALFTSAKQNFTVTPAGNDDNNPGVTSGKLVSKEEMGSVE
jgi:hypothetical protein